MFCKKCGNEIHTNTCPKCGQDHSALTQDKETEPSSLFLEEDEVLCGELRRGLISHALLDGSLASDFVILSDRRIYCSGVMFASVMGSELEKIRGQITFPLEQVSSFGVYAKSNISSLVGWVLVAVVLFIVALAVGQNLRSDEAAAVFAALAVAAVVIGVVKHFLSRQRHLVISSSSQTFEIDFRLYGKKAIGKFVGRLGPVLTAHRRSLFREYVGGKFSALTGSIEVASTMSKRDETG